METNETEPTCEGCKNRDRMIRQLSERIDELERTRVAAIRTSAESAVEGFMRGLLNEENKNENANKITQEPA